MNSKSKKLNSMTPKELEDYGFARARDLTYDAVSDLLRKRLDEGRTQTDIAASIGRDPGWLSRQFSGPGNWTMRTFGSLVEALNGDIEIKIVPKEQPLVSRTNWHAYCDYEDDLIVDGDDSMEFFSEASPTNKDRLLDDNIADLQINRAA